MQIVAQNYYPFPYISTNDDSENHYSFHKSFHKSNIFFHKSNSGLALRKNLQTREQSSLVWEDPFTNEQY